MKKPIIIATGIFLFILTLFLILSFTFKNSQVAKTQPFSPTPTTVQIDGNRILNDTDISLLNQAKSFAPYETDSFRYSYSAVDNYMVVEEKKPQGKADFNQWLAEKNFQELADNNNLIFYKTASSSPFEYYNNPQNNFILNFFNIFGSINENLRKGNGQPVLSPTEIPENPPNSSSNNQQPNNPPSTNLTYYGQGTEPYASIKLPPTCILRNCGCGPTSVAMIASSYLSTDYDPQKIVDIYNKNGYNACCGSYITDARSVLEELGLKTSDLIINEDPPVPAGQVASQFKKYLNSGWTIMVLAYYEPNKGGGHYFWITDIDNDGNILAYDPWYGQGSSPPISENQYSPFPEYSQAFAVKK